MVTDTATYKRTSDKDRNSVTDWARHDQTRRDLIFAQRSFFCFSADTQTAHLQKRTKPTHHPIFAKEPFLSTLTKSINRIYMKTITLILLAFLSSCATSKIAKTGIDQISFGSGGGFTGEVKTYTLNQDSKLFEKEKELKKIDSKTTLELFNQASELKEYSFNTPENMYSFIEIKTKEKTNRIVWGYGATTVDKKATELYNKLISTTK